MTGLMKNAEFYSLEEGTLGIFSLVYFLSLSKHQAAEMTEQRSFNLLLVLPDSAKD